MRIRSVFLFSLCLIPFTSVAAETAYEQRINRENQWMDQGLPFLPHRPTYILPLAMNKNPNPIVLEPSDPDLDKNEVKYQISFKVPVVRKFFSERLHLFFAYTQLAMWQVYNPDLSRPYRDTNYEPEGFFDLDATHKIGPFESRGVQLGFDHQSNGRGDDLYRSWNRVFAQFNLDRDNFLMQVKPWFRIPESEKYDNNPDIDHYMGYGELRLTYKFRRQVWSGLFRNNLNPDDNKGAMDLTWSFPLIGVLKGTVQYFCGYGESLIDYNHLNNRISAGLLISDWL